MKIEPKAQSMDHSKYWKIGITGVILKYIAFTVFPNLWIQIIYVFSTIFIKSKILQYYLPNSGFEITNLLAYSHLKAGIYHIVEIHGFRKRAFLI